MRYFISLIDLFTPLAEAKFCSLTLFNFVMAENVAGRDNAARRPVPRLPIVSLTVFDASHCYWLEPQLLLDRILQIESLEELSINDTKFGLSHLLQIFKVCTKIRKLSFSLMEAETLDQFQEQRVTRSQVSKESIMKP